MEMVAYSEKNRSVVIPWILDPEHDGFDLEVDGCGCGCGDGGCGSCGCSCTCSCSCSCSCDDTGANGDDDDGSFDDSGDSDSPDFAATPNFAAAGQCLLDATVNIAGQAVTEVSALVLGKGATVPTAVAGAAASSSMISAAWETPEQSSACQQLDEDQAQFGAERLAEMEGSDSFQKAIETFWLVH